MTERLSDFESSYSAIALGNANPRTWRTSLSTTVEPVVFLLCIATTMTAPVTTNLFLVNTCEVILGYSRTVCEELGDKKFNDTENLETSVQKEATYFTMGRSLIEAIIPAILSFYIGPWSDLNGRKPLMKWPILGFGVTYIVYLVESLFPGLSPYILMISSMPAAICGGFITFLSGLFSYVSDVTSPEKRAWRMGMVEISLYGGILVGMFSSSYVYNFAGSLGYVAVFGVSSLFCLLSWFYCCLFLNESVVNDESEYPCCCLSNGLFKSRYVVSMFSVCRERRPNYGRAISLMLILILGSCVFVIDGESAVVYLFSRAKFSFTLQDFTTFVSISIAINIAGVFCGTYIQKRTKFSLAGLATFGFLMKLIAAIVTAISPNYWYLYLGASISFFGASVGPWSRALLSNNVAGSEIGKVFSLVAALEALAPLGAAPLFTLLYNVSIDSFPGSFFLLSGGIYLMDAILLVIIVVLNKRTRHRQDVCDNLIDENKINNEPSESINS